ISVSGYWNIDEVGIIIAMLNRRFEVLVLNIEKKILVKIVDFYNRKSTTIISASNALGDAIPTYNIFKEWLNEN
ncbi:uncharacterized protein THITE_40408, partial [Thermothielavioides terrestris NRRL 8126]